MRESSQGSSFHEDGGEKVEVEEEDYLCRSALCQTIGHVDSFSFNYEYTLVVGLYGEKFDFNLL